MVLFTNDPWELPQNKELAFDIAYHGAQYGDSYILGTYVMEFFFVGSICFYEITDKMTCVKYRGPFVL